MSGPPLLPPNEVDPETARRVADAVLAGPDYDGLTLSPIELARRWIFDRVQDVLEMIAGADGASAVGAVLLGLFVISGLVLVIRFGRGARFDRRATATISTGLRGAEDWEADAARHRLAGQLRDAVMCRHHALVARLEGAAVLGSSSAGRTAGEVASAASDARPDLAVALHDVTRRFEVAVYGAASPTLEAVDDLAASCGQIESSVRHRLVAGAPGAAT